MWVIKFLNHIHIIDFFVIKPTRFTNFVNSFRYETLHFSDSSSVHHQEFIHCTLSNGMSYNSVDRLRAGRRWNGVPSWSCSQTVYKPVWHIPLLSVQWINWWWTDELSQKHVEFHAKNKFAKLVHLVGFIIKKFVTMHRHTNVKLTYTSVQYSTFEVLHPCPHHTAERPHCAATSLQYDRSYLIFSDLRRDSVELQKTQSAEIFQKCCRIIADFSQNIEFLFCLCFVSLVWTRPDSCHQLT
jgi:hypothetical protein